MIIVYHKFFACGSGSWCLRPLFRAWFGLLCSVKSSVKIFFCHTWTTRSHSYVSVIGWPCPRNSMYGRNTCELAESPLLQSPSFKQCRVFHTCVLLFVDACRSWRRRNPRHAAASRPEDLSLSRLHSLDIRLVMPETLLSFVPNAEHTIFRLPTRRRSPLLYSLARLVLEP